MVFVCLLLLLIVVVFAGVPVCIRGDIWKQYGYCHYVVIVLSKTGMVAGIRVSIGTRVWWWWRWCYFILFYWFPFIDAVCYVGCWLLCDDGTVSYDVSNEKLGRCDEIVPYDDGGSTVWYADTHFGENEMSCYYFIWWKDKYCLFVLLLLIGVLNDGCSSRFDVAICSLS